MKDNKIVKVTGDPDHPVNRGVICERGRLMPDHVYHTERLNYPLKRVGEKGRGRWRQLSWGQALDEVAEKLSELKDRYGAETLAFTHAPSAPTIGMPDAFSTSLGRPTRLSLGHFFILETD